MIGREELSTVVIADAPGRHDRHGARVYSAHLSTSVGLRNAIARWEELRPGVAIYIAPSGTRKGAVVHANNLSHQSPDEIEAWARVAPEMAI